MDVVELLAELEETIEKGIEIPIIKKSFLDKEKLLDIINDISLSIPEEISNAKTITADRERILADAQRQADMKIKEAEHKAISMIDEHEITRKAYEQKAEIIETANEMSREISKGTKDYADNVLGKIEVVLEDALKTIQTNRRELQ